MGEAIAQADRNKFEGWNQEEWTCLATSKIDRKDG